MRILIVGGGIVGNSLAEYLLNEKHNLALVEIDPELCMAVSEKLDMQVINGSGSSPAVLKEAGIENADMILAVTPSNEINMVACSIAAQYGVSRRIARLRGHEFVSEKSMIDLNKMGITSVIHPEKVLIDQIMQYVDTPHAIQAANFEEGKILMRGYKIDEKMPIAGKSMREIPLILFFSQLLLEMALV
jgi:trk system potassium uptake protein TrkA